MKKRLILLFLGLCSVAHAQTGKIAVWNPDKGTPQPPNRFTLDLPRLQATYATLQKAGLDVEWVSAAQLANSAALSAQKYDALVMPGDAFPKAATKNLLDFGQNGGILIGLNGRIPFNARVEPTPDGMWDLSPNQGFAWQSGEIQLPFGIRYIYDPARFDQGVNHLPTPLLKKYLPEAPEIRGRKIPSMWIVPAPGAQFFPLLDSKRLDGVSVVPQLFVSRSGKRTAIMSLSPTWTQNSDSKLWPMADQTVVALARLALDLRSGTTKLENPIDLPANLPGGEPLRTRVSSSEVNPEGAKPLARWGKFDGTSLENGPLVAREKTVQVAAGGQLPRGLLGGGKITLVTPNVGNEPVFLRIRGGFRDNNSGLKVAVRGQTLWNELFTQAEAGGEGNFSGSMDGVPTEWTRRFFVPPGGGPLEISNPGRAAIYFDALQLETLAQTPQFRIGAMWTDLGGPTFKLDPAKTKKWSIVRCNARTQNIGPPDDPKRWDKLDELFKSFTATGAPIHLIFEGTPQWAAISPERYEEARKAGRPHTTVPDPQKYAGLARDIVKRYGDKIEFYEFWNEIDIQQFWRGTMPEYIAFCQAVIPVVKQLDPTAKIITAGLAGYKETAVSELIASGLFAQSDWVAFHPYNGQSTGWDVPFGTMQGQLYANGLDTPIYCDESGFVWQPAEWFQNPAWSPELQKTANETAMGRLFASGLTQFALFHASGSNHAYDVYDAQGKPRPAAAVFEDYARLGEDGGRRFDVSLAPTSDAPLQGVYLAGALHQNGSATLIINAANSPSFEREVVLRLPRAFKSVTATNEEGAVPITLNSSEARLKITGRVVVSLAP